MVFYLKDCHWRKSTATGWRTGIPHTALITAMFFVFRIFFTATIFCSGFFFAT